MAWQFSYQSCHCVSHKTVKEVLCESTQERKFKSKYQKCIKCLNPLFYSYTLQHYQVFICQPTAINTALTITKILLFLRMRLHTSATCLPE